MLHSHHETGRLCSANWHGSTMDELWTWFSEAVLISKVMMAVACLPWCQESLLHSVGWCICIAARTQMSSPSQPVHHLIMSFACCAFRQPMFIPHACTCSQQCAHWGTSRVSTLLRTHFWYFLSACQGRSKVSINFASKLTMKQAHYTYTACTVMQSLVLATSQCLGSPASTWLLTTLMPKVVAFSFLVCSLWCILEWQPWWEPVSSRSMTHCSQRRFPSVGRPLQTRSRTLPEPAPPAYWMLTGVTCCLVVVTTALHCCCRRVPSVCQ